MIILSTFKEKKESNKESELTYKTYTNEIEEKIENFLLNVDGIRNVNVIVTLDSINTTSNSDNSLLNITNNRDNSHYFYPTVRGVAIACTNGDNDEIKNKITRLVSSYLGIPTNRIEIVNFG